LQHLSYWLLQGKQSLCGFFVVTTVTNIFLSLNQMMITSPHEYVQYNHITQICSIASFEHEHFTR